MNTLIAAGILTLLAPRAGAGQAANQAIALNFVKTDVSIILRTIGMRTGTNIIYSDLATKTETTENTADSKLGTLINSGRPVASENARGDVTSSRTESKSRVVSLSFTARNAEEAIRATAAAAGLTYRKVDTKDKPTFVVAAPEALRLALAPFAIHRRVRTEANAQMRAYIQSSLPQITVLNAPSGFIELVGVPQDIAAAEDLLSQDLLESARTEGTLGQVVTESVTLRLATAGGVITALRNLYPDLQIVPITGTGSAAVGSLQSNRNGSGTSSTSSAETSQEGGQSGAATDTGRANANVDTSRGISAAQSSAETEAKGGTLIIMGRAKLVAEAKKKAIEMDTSVSSLSNDTAIQTYDIKYAGARAIVDFVREAAPEVQISIVPPTHTPDDLQRGATQTTVTAAGGQTGAASPAPITSPNGTGNNDASDPNGTGLRGVAKTYENDYDRATQVLLKGRKSDVDRALEILKSLDVRPQQVVVDVRIVDASPEAIDKVGLKYSWSNINFLENPAGTLVSGAQDFTRKPGLGTISRVPMDFLATLDLMTQRTDAKIMANPSMQVISNQEANFFIGDQVSVQLTNTNANGQNSSVATYNIGISLNVRPRVNANGDITMRLNPIVESLTGVTNGLPQTNSREANTVVMVHDGETVVLGGLIRDEDIRTVTEVPLLSKLPIVGQLFRHNSRDHRKSNIIVTVTPHIVPMPSTPGGTSK